MKHKNYIGCEMSLFTELKCDNNKKNFKQRKTPKQQIVAYRNTLQRISESLKKSQRKKRIIQKTKVAKIKKDNESNEGKDTQTHRLTIKKEVTQKSFQFETVAKKCQDRVCHQCT